MRPGRARACCWITGFLITVVCAVTATACSSTSAVGSWTPIASHERILLLPPESAGWAGWCMKTGSTLISGCGAYARARPPILAETWWGHGEGPSKVIQGFALTTSEVAYVAIKHGPPVRTDAQSGLPAGLRAIVVELHGKGPANREPFPRFTPLNSKGEKIRSTLPGGELATWTKPSRVPNARRPSLGVCRIEAEPLSGLIPTGGSVITHVSSYSNFLGQAFQVCADTSYSVHKWPLLATVLLSAASPGSRPASLPAALPLPGHPGIFYEPDVTGGETLARRVAGAWLIVSKGESRQQRLQVLEHLRATIHLSDSPSV